MQTGWFILIPWFFTLLTPFIVYIFVGGDVITETQMGEVDAEILAIARKYGGILTQSVVVWETKVALEEAKKRLERFCKYGEAYKRNIGSLIVYDFPSTRTYLSRTDNQIIELLRDNPYGMSRAQLLQATGLSIESLDEALKRLETKGIIYYDVESEIYKLMGIAPTTKNKGAAK
jgi:DNA-binding transcriptional ArsR family regulator